MQGICLKKPLFYATVEGRKTQTRRKCNIQPLDNDKWIFSQMVCTTNKEEQKHKGKFHFVTKKDEFTIGKYDNRYFLPRYKTGEIVYLKEPYYVIDDVIFYKYVKKDISGADKWQNKLFMPAKYARYFIKITSIRCKRLQDISDEDCIKEGIKHIEFTFPARYTNRYDNNVYSTPQQAYAALIDKISGRGTWESNPYVWVYEYELTDYKK